MRRLREEEGSKPEGWGLRRVSRPTWCWSPVWRWTDLPAAETAERSLPKCTRLFFSLPPSLPSSLPFFLDLA